MNTPASWTTTIPVHANGPDNAANGGYACGAFARLADAADPDHAGPRAVTLHHPVPLGRPLCYEGSGRRGLVVADGEVIASVARAVDQIPAVAPVDEATALLAQERFAGRVGHPFPRCYACGERADGLRVRPGQVTGTDLVACVWTPEPGTAGGDRQLVSREAATAALDCPGGWTEDARRGPRVLGRMVAVVDVALRVGQPYIVVATEARRDERSAVRRVSLYPVGGDGAAPHARSEAIWVALTT